MNMTFFSPAPRADDEEERQRAVDRLLVEEPSDPAAIAEIVREVADLLNCAAAAVSILDGDRQWFAGSVGIDVAETSRAVSFCAHVILTPERVLHVPDATADRRFAGNPLVLGAPHIRFYAGAPIIARGALLGALCGFDQSPRLVSKARLQRLREFADLAATAL